MERAALIPAFSRREKEKVLRGFRRVEPGIRWNESRRLARMGFWSHSAGARDSLYLRERVGVREPVSTLAIAGMERFMGRLLFKTDLLTDLEPKPRPLRRRTLSASLPCFRLVTSAATCFTVHGASGTQSAGRAVPSPARALHQAKIPFTNSPWMSVRRKSRP
jgi:hypothetical protein